MNKDCGVYLIVSPSNGRYVGSSKSLKKRFNRYKNLSCHKQSALLSSLKKYGYENHTVKVLMYCNEHERLFWERVFGDIYLSLADFSNGLNIILPSYEDVPAVFSKEHRRKISETQKMRFSTTEARRINGEKTKQGLSSPETRRRLSESASRKFKNEDFLNEHKRKRKEYYTEFRKEEISKKVTDFYENNPVAKKAATKVLTDFHEQHPDFRKTTMDNYYKNNPSAGQEQAIKLRRYYEENPQAKQAASDRSKEQFLDRANHPQSKAVINMYTNETYACAKEVVGLIGKCYNTVLKLLNNPEINKTPYRYK